jgi:hypothetical protein
MTDLLLATITAADETPADNDVVAGPIGFAIFIALLIAVALLGWSLSKHLKKAHRAADAGVYGDVKSDSDVDQDAGGPQA